MAVQEGLLSPDADLLAPRFYLAPGVRDWIRDYTNGIMAVNPRRGY
jgi:hypothetical protein